MDKRRKLPFFLLFNILLLSATIASETTLLDVDFSAVENLAGWTDVSQKNPPNPNNYYVKEGALATAPTEFFGLSHPLRKPLVISEDAGRIVVECTFLQPQESRGRTISVALTSRATTCPYNGGAFWPGKEDSGFLAAGNVYGIQSANHLSYMREGRQITAFAPRTPFNFISGTDNVWTWRIVMDTAERSLRLFTSNDADKPAAEIYGVNLDGEELKALWVSSFGTRYFKIKVLQIKE